MEKAMHDEMSTTIKELRDWAGFSLKLAEKVEQIRGQIVAWENRRENAELLARNAQADLEAKQSELLVALQRLPNELAPLKNKIAQQERDAAKLMTEAMLAKKEAASLLEIAKARALPEYLKQPEQPATEEKRGPGRPKKEPVRA